MSFKKHIGRIKNTDRRCIVVMTQIPGRDDHALIVDTDALPDRFHDALMQVVESHEGQQADELHGLLTRRILPDFGVDILNALHNAGALSPQPISNIVMYPQPHSPCPLSLIVEMQKQNAPVTRNEQTDMENRHLENQKMDATENDLATAGNLLRHAADLDAEAAKKREQAYRIVPALRPAETAPAAPVEALAAPVNVENTTDTSEVISSTPQAEVIEIASVVDISPPAPAVPFDNTLDTSGLPADVAAAYVAAVEQAQVGPTLLSESLEEEEPAHAVDLSDDALQTFLDRAAFREDKANKIATEATEPKRPVGRPRKDGAPAGSKRA